MDSANKTQLVRGLSLIAAISIVIGNVIGTGVFLKARVMTCNVGTPKLVLFVYVIAGLLSLAGALSYAELAAMMPKAGGEYVFMREAYGRPWGFLFGWMSFFIGKAGSQAALGVQFALFLNIMLGEALAGDFFSIPLWGHPVPLENCRWLLSLRSSSSPESIAWQSRLVVASRHSCQELRSPWCYWWASALSCLPATLTGRIC